jgi:hypothetical protein
MKKIGLVIQGPLISIGKSGEQFYWSLDKLQESGGAIHYDCRENIQRLITEFGPLFDEIIISTWDNEVKPEDSWIGAKLVAAPDPGGIPRANRKHYKDNNKFRQFLSTLNGLVELEKSGIDHAIKVRTDTYLDLAKLVESYLAGIKKTNDDSRSIYAPVVHHSTFLIHDLYFAGHLKTMKEFCEAVLAYERFEFISSAHMEIVLKHAYGKYKEIIGVHDWAYFPLSPLMGVSAETRKIFEYMLENIYHSLEPTIFKDLLWRGSRFPADHVEGLVKVENPKNKKYNVPGLIATDWERYFHFREEVFGKQMSFQDKLLTAIGKLGWRMRNKARKVMKLLQ